MAEVSVSYKISAEKEVLDVIKCMLEAIEEEGLEDFYIDEDADALEIEVDSMDANGVLAWTVLLQQVINEVKGEEFLFKSIGVADNDYYSYTAFEIECSQDIIKRRTVDFNIEDEVEELDDQEEWIYVYEDEEEKAYEKMEKTAFSVLKVEIDMEEEYEVAKEALEEFLDAGYDE